MNIYHIPIIYLYIPVKYDYTIMYHYIPYHAIIWVWANTLYP